MTASRQVARKLLEKIEYSFSNYEKDYDKVDL